METCVNSAFGKIYCCPIWFCYNSTVTHNHESNLIYCKKARISHHHFFSVFIFPLFTSFFLSLVFSIFPFSLVLKIDWWKTFSKSICSSLLFLCSAALSILPSFWKIPAQAPTSELHHLLLQNYFRSIITI